MKLHLMVVYDVKDTKFEWNSQLLAKFIGKDNGLFMMSKIQNLNGTHNFSYHCRCGNSGCL